MTIARRGFVINPADNVTLYDSVERSVDPTGMGCASGDLVRLVANRRGLDAIAMNKLGGQTWNHGSVRQTGSSSALMSWCIFNGTWDTGNLPSIATVADPTRCIQLYMDAWIPSAGGNTLRATSRRSWRWTARNTRPIPPPPKSSNNSYSPRV